MIRVSNCTRHDVYNPAANQWQAGQAFAGGGRCGAVSVASSNGSVYVFGGDYLPSPGRTVVAYYSGGG
ncbi:MAG TPA: hypothetical protein VKR30_10935 [Candidatus Limnocylindrales bacterium]|nr:hypothetical protein [Candidatus Limnocylindrales bacterium]